LNDGKCKYCDDIDTVDIKEYYKKSTWHATNTQIYTPVKFTPQYESLL
jgi:hypothetical protein